MSSSYLNFLTLFFPCPPPPPYPRVLFSQDMLNICIHFFKVNNYCTTRTSTTPQTTPITCVNPHSTCPHSMCQPPFHMSPFHVSTPIPRVSIPILLLCTCMLWPSGAHVHISSHWKVAWAIMPSLKITHGIWLLTFLPWLWLGSCIVPVRGGGGVSSLYLWEEGVGSHHCTCGRTNRCVHINM